MASEITPIMTDIFRQSLATGTLPSVWKTAHVSPIFKKGAVYAAENYRPVSLTCIPCKLMEHILCSHVRSHLDRYGLLTPRNHGFRKGHSCDTQLLLTMQDLLERKDKTRSQTDIGVLDFAKAFDKVPHGRLINKLRIYGIDEQIARWIESFLGNRTQNVIVDGAESEYAAVRSGVPQGTVMGPLLFLLFINDLPSVVDPGTEVRLFADDCLVYRSIHSLKDQIQFQLDLDALHKWGKLWGMKFNAKKCHILTVTNKEQPLSKFYELDGTILDHVDSATYLGILIHESLRSTEHVRNTVTKCSRRLGFLRRNLKNCPQELRKVAYLSLVRSAAEYGAAAWDPFLEGDKVALERVQNRAIRWVCGLRPRERTSITRLRGELKWPTLERRRKDIRLLYMFKILNNEIALTPEQLHLDRSDQRTRARHNRKLRVKRARTEELKNSFVYRTVPQWNQLPASIAEASSIDQFKSRLTEELLD